MPAALAALSRLPLRRAMLAHNLGQQITTEKKTSYSYGFSPDWPAHRDSPVRRPSNHLKASKY
jgi:hypothetical protein